MINYDLKLKNLLSLAVEKKVSDLHFSDGHPPTFRMAGKLSKNEETGVLTADDCQGMAFALLDEKQKDKFLREKEIDLSYNFENKNRFRVNIFFQKGTVSCSLRRVAAEVPGLEELNLPPILGKFTEQNQGLVLITGPSSHGKSTTLAGLIDRINHNFFKRIITIEDPIEYIFKDDKSIIEQREVHYDTESFSRALKSVFRQDPDVIMVGEMRDPETIATVITAAETGHLVFSTLHTNSAGQSIHRIIDSFPGEQQSQIRSQLALSLLGIVSQRLIPRKGGGIVPACEIMFSTPATANIIREGRVHELDFIIETSGGEGMISLNKYLSHLIQEDEISVESALMYSRRPSELKKFIG